MCMNYMLVFYYSVGTIVRTAVADIPMRHAHDVAAIRFSDLRDLSR
jgi:hypothetical protein